MPKKLKKFKRNVDVAEGTKENSENTGCYVNIGERNVKTWYSFKEKLNFKLDCDFVEHLLSLIEKCTSPKLNHHAAEVNGEQNCDRPSTRHACTEDGEARVLATVNDNASKACTRKVCKNITSTANELEEPSFKINQLGDECNEPSAAAIETEDANWERAKVRRGRTYNELDSTEPSSPVKNKNQEDSFIPSNKSEEEAKLNADEIEVELDELNNRDTSNFKLCPYCDIQHVDETCPLFCPSKQISDAFAFEEWQSGHKAGLEEIYAESSLPRCLEIKDVDGKHGCSIFTRVEISENTEFGPLVGEPIKEMEIPDDFSMKHIWEVGENKYLNTRNPNVSNWLRWLRPAPTRQCRNIVPISRDGFLYFVTTCLIKPGKELLYWAEMTGAWSLKKMEKTSCGGCNVQFDHPMYYRTHCAVFHEARLSLTVRKYHCKICGKAVLGKQNIMKHAILYHDGKGAYQCQFCSKFFLRLNYLDMHRNYGCSANPHRARPLCDFCGRKFCQPQKLKVHIKRMHSELTEVLREFQCSDCLKVLGSRAALQRHTKEVHHRPSGVSCSKCSKTFQNRSNLKIHMLTHSGIKPFKCQVPECAAAFTTKQCLQFHYRKVHRLTEEQFPKIVRSVEYTFDAYSGEGGIPDTENESSEGALTTNGENLEQESENSTPVPEELQDTAYKLTNEIEGTGEGHEDRRWIENFDTCHNTPEKSGCVRDNDKLNSSTSYHYQTESSNGSLLAEAALDAAEKDIDVCRSHSPDIQSGNIHELQQTPNGYSALQEEDAPLSSPKNYSLYQRSYSIERQYNVHSSLENNEYPVQEDIRFQQRAEEIDENAIQNLSVPKDRSAQLDLSYKYDEERNLEHMEGLDMSRNSLYHHSGFISAPRYPTLYEQHYAHSEVLRVMNIAQSVDLSLPRPTHHQILPQVAQIDPDRIISPTAYSAYPVSPNYLPPARPPSPTYHHYSTYY